MSLKALEARGKANHQIEAPASRRRLQAIEVAGTEFTILQKVNIGAKVLGTRNC